MIPKIIWQTYKHPYDELMPYMKDAAQTWKDLNPEYEYRYVDDLAAAEFVAEYFGKEWFNIFVNVPIGVMRADIWRYMVIYQHGGVYADLDTLCLKSISTWMKDDKDMIVCPENDWSLCQWTFAATPGHPIIKNVLDLIKRGFKNPDYTEKHFVHKLTGPVIWTKGIRDAINIPENAKLNEMDKIQLDLPKAKEYNFYSYGSENARIFHDQAVKHLYGSQNWHEGYVQWIKQIPYLSDGDTSRISWREDNESIISKERKL